ncbi:hypothetical protein [Streptomyces sp. NPDC090057]|uniref:hypothetical protein n=1 Tax=Streptomyces sp. NPDC090057 TaxID=3365935 RepID=UPI00380A47FF
MSLACHTLRLRQRPGTRRRGQVRRAAVSYRPDTTGLLLAGRKQRFQLQVYYQGSWHDSGSEYFALGSGGKSAVRLEAAGTAGVRARMRSSYVNGSSGDSVNSTTHGAWKYFTFTN